MGYSISWETHERIEKNRREDRLCQGSGRCSTRATRVIVIDSPGRGRQTHVCCKKHTDELVRSAEYWGVVFANEPGSTIKSIEQIGRDEHGTAARERALYWAGSIQRSVA